MKQPSRLLILFFCLMLLSLSGCAPAATPVSSGELLQVELSAAEYGKVFPEKNAEKLPYFYQVTIQCNPEITTYCRSAIDLTKDSDEVKERKQYILETYLQTYADNFSEIENPTVDLIVYTPAKLTLTE